MPGRVDGIAAAAGMGLVATMIEPLITMRRFFSLAE
jgi:hypothetical protein